MVRFGVGVNAKDRKRQDRSSMWIRQRVKWSLEYADMFALPRPVFPFYFIVFSCRICDISYLGLSQERLEGDEYLQVVDEFVAAAKARWPKVLIQVSCCLLLKLFVFVAFWWWR